MTTPADAAPDSTSKPAKFSREFWQLNSIEMLERLSYYNLRVMAPIYIMQADCAGGLHLSATDKGVIYAWWAAVQSLIPIFTGGLADRWGYKATLYRALSLMALGYFIIAFGRGVEIGGHNLDYPLFFGGVLVMALGTAFFKPSIQGALYQRIPDSKASVGWGIFYWIVNIGALVGHFLPTGILNATGNTATSWQYLFALCGIMTIANLFLVAPLKDIPTGARPDPLGTVLVRTLTNILNPRLLLWILIMSGFWMMMMQLWDLQPNFITDWVDTSGMAHAIQNATWLNFPGMGFDLRELIITTQNGQPVVPQQTLLSINSICIILGVVPAAWLTRKMRTLAAMLIGMVFVTAGLLVAGYTQAVWFLVLGICGFSIGEMLTGPKKSEYLASIAPEGKKGLYLGYLNIPAGIGAYFGSLLGGWLYNDYGEKANLALRYIATQTPEGRAKNWNGDVATLSDTLNISRPEAFDQLVRITGKTPQEATDLLWNLYHPQLYTWLPFAAIGLLSIVGLAIYNQKSKKWAQVSDTTRS